MARGGARWPHPAADFPAAPQAPPNRARSQMRQGDKLRQLGKLSEARAALQQAVAVLEALVAEFPGVSEYRLNLARGHTYLATLYRAARSGIELFRTTRSGAEAEAANRRALAILEPLAADFPGLPDCRQLLAMNHSGLGVLF